MKEWANFAKDVLSGVISDGDVNVSGTVQLLCERFRIGRGECCYNGSESTLGIRPQWANGSNVA